MQDDAEDHTGAAPVARSLSKVLSAHGHAFHYAVMRRAEELSAKSGWTLDATEFPVATGNSVTHIDFILRAQRGQAKQQSEGDGGVAHGWIPVLTMTPLSKP